MELRRAPDAILRMQSFPFSSLLSPSCHSTKRYNASHIRKASPTKQLAPVHTVSRTFTIPMRPSTTASPPPSTTPLPPSPFDLQREELSKDLGWTSGRPTKPTVGRRPTFPSNVTSWDQPSSSSTFPDPSSTEMSEAEKRERALNGGSTANDLLRAISGRTFKQGGASMPSQRSAFGMTYPTSFVSQPNNHAFQNMINPDSGKVSSDASSAPEDMLERVRKDLAKKSSELRKNLKLRPKLGRTVDVTTNIDVGRAIALLEMSCARNKVRLDSRRQERHHRAGAKKKRLRQERWRKTFMEGFRHVIGRVRKLNRQGW